MNHNRYEPLGIGSGTLIAGRYELDRKIGAGGMSAVFSARDKALNNQECAIKILEPRLLSNPQDLERFRNEVVITRKLTHPNIVRTYEFGQSESGIFFVTMEYVRGTNLHQHIYDPQNVETLSFALIVRILADVADALAFAHEQGVIHRDLKPANVLLTRDLAVKITDFGLAQTTELQIHLTQAGECVGTPAYMAPEQIQGKSVDGRADIYSLGILGHELLAGSLPFYADEWYDLATKVFSEPMPKLSSKKVHAPEWFEEFLQTACAKDPANRYATAAEAAAALRSHFDRNDTVVLGGRHRQRLVNRRAGGAALPDFGKFAPAMTMISLALVLMMLAIGSGAEKVSAVEGRMAKGKDILRDLVDSVRDLTDTAIMAHKNRQKIRMFIHEKSAEEEAALQQANRPAGETEPDSPAASDAQGRSEAQAGLEEQVGSDAQADEGSAASADETEETAKRNAADSEKGEDEPKAANEDEAEGAEKAL